MNETRQQAERARKAFLKLATGVDRTAILKDLATALRENAASIFEANQKDLAEAKAAGIAEPLYKRLILNEPKFRDVITGIEQIAAMEDPVGRVVQETQLDEELILKKVQTPIGVLAMIYESRPDAGPQIAALSIRTGNAVLLKGGREAKHTNLAIGEVIRAVLDKYGVRDVVQLVSTREEIAELLNMDDLINLVIPRGSNEMVRTIQRSTKIPVLGHADGICHVYIDEFADPDKAARIAVDSKAQYPAVCNSAETLLVHAKFPAREKVLDALRSAGVELRDSGFGSEYLDLIMNVKIVNSLDEAIDHIHRYGSSHTDTIVTQNGERARRFLNEVDSAGVFWNASTRFADGFRYGFGAEVGVSTNKTHARGPVGVEGLMIYKYQLIGNGHVVATYTGENARPFCTESCRSRGFLATFRASAQHHYHSLASHLLFLRQRLPHVRHALLHFLDRGSRTSMFIFDQRPNRILFFLKQQQHLLDRCIALAPRYIRTLIFLSIFQVQMRDLVVIVPNELDRIEIRRREMSDVQIDFERLRHCERFGKTLGSSEFIRILNVGMAVHRDIHLVLLREGDKAFRNAQLS